LSFYDSRGESSFTKPYSEETAKIIDEEASKIIEKAYVRAKELLKANKDKLTKLANKLLEKEVIFKDDLKEIIGERKWKSSQEMLDEAEQNGSVKELASDIPPAPPEAPETGAAPSEN